MLFRSAVDVMWRAGVPMAARQIPDALIAEKAPQAARKQAIDTQAAILVAPRKRDAGAVELERGRQLRRPLRKWAIFLFFAVVYHDRHPRSLVDVVIEEHGVIADAPIFLIDPANAQYKVAGTMVSLA